MRFLYVVVTPPLPLINGVRMRYWALLRALAAEGHEVDLIAPEFPGQAAAWDELRTVCREVIPVPMRLPGGAETLDWRGRLSGLASPVPYTVLRFRSPQAKEKILSACRRGRYDAAIVTPYTIVNVPEGGRLPLIIDAHNVEHRLLERYLRYEPNPARRAYAWLEIAKLRNWERRTLARSALVMACSQVDRNLLESMCPNANVAVVPNTVDVETYAAPTCDGDGTLLYVGGMDWFPNRHAVAFFVTRVLPELRKYGCRVKFRVFSPDHPAPQAFLWRLGKVPELEFVPAQDIRSVMAAASVFVVPLHIGGGTRFKILEAGAMGKPIVSTHVGAEGLNFRNGSEILLEDEPAAFAAAIAGLLADASRGWAMGEAARARVEQEYSFPVLRTSVRHALARFQEAIGQHNILSTRV